MIQERARRQSARVELAMTTEQSRIIRSPFPDVDIPNVPLADYVLQRAESLGDKPALVDAASGRTLTFAEVAADVRAVAAGLARRGLKKGDVLGIYSPNLPEYAIPYHATAMLGGVCTTASPLLTSGELATQL